MAEVFVDSVMDQVHELNVQQLVELCDKYKVVVPDEKKDRRGALVVLLTAFVATQQDATDGEDVLGNLDGDIGKMLKKTKVKKEEDQSNSAKVAGVTGKVTDTEETIDQKATKSQASDSEVMKQRMELWRGLRNKEFKLDGHVGRTSGCMKWSDLEFQIKKGKTAGYTFDEIKNGVIKAMKSGSSIHTYFIDDVDEDVEEDVFMELLRDYHIIQDATEIFNEMVDASQEPDEFPSDYAYRILGMCKSVIKLSRKEECQYPESFVRKKCFHALSVGFIEPSIRADLKEILQDIEKTDKEILAAVGTAEARDRELKKRLKGKTSAVNNVYAKRDRGNDGAGSRKDRENEDAARGTDRSGGDSGKADGKGIDPLLVAMTKMSDKIDNFGKVVHRVDKLEAGLARVEEQLARSSLTVNPPGPMPVIPALGRGGGGFAGGPAGGAAGGAAGGVSGGVGGGGARRRIKCQACENGNVRFCVHCNKCGEAGHQRKNCPN